ncbi:hypothetical protein ABIB83_007955 [Bradyrhizobium sp. I1.8.5]|uniref:hypothetical protein n=1 Tax=Bradyrhizobium sp. I1.8.5 TaxID=3156365 RepID=UPI00339251B8
MIAYAQEALDDARSRIRKGFEDDLSPFNSPVHDPAANYPAQLNRITLQGYLGETLAALAVEHYGAMGHFDWQVPALLFRFHDQEFQHLELINERLLAGAPHDPDAIIERRPGRTGDDGLAFRIDQNGIITDILTLEAKCLTASNTEIMKDAHEKLVAGGQRPSGVRELINLLQEYDTPEANAWQEALLRFYRDGFRTAARHDGLAYAVGHSPQVPSTRISWLPPDAPHPAYTIQRNLDAMEFQFENLDAVVDILYRAG